MSEAGFQVRRLDLLRMNKCNQSSLAVPRAAGPSVSSTTRTASEIATVPSKEPQTGKANIIIVVAVAICVLIVIVIAIVKCRSRMKAKRAEEAKNTSGADFTADATDPLKRIPPSNNPDQRRNHNAPVMLEGEGEEHVLLVKSPQANSRPDLTNSREDCEALAPTIDEKRPPPPPYFQKTVAT